MESIKYKINIINHIRVEGHALYVISVENINSGVNLTFKERYSNLRNLYELMKKESSDKNFPSFPPKKYFGYDDEKFVTTREKELNIFFEKINNNVKYSKLPSLIKFIQENLKKNPNKEKISSRKIQYSIQSKNDNKNTSKPFKGIVLTKEEYIKGCSEGKKIIDEYKQKFVSLDYDIEIKSNDKAELKYQSLIKNDLIFNKKIEDLIQLDKGVDENFKYIGNDEENVNDIVNKIKNVIELNTEKFDAMSKLIDFKDFILE